MFHHFGRDWVSNRPHLQGSGNDVVAAFLRQRCSRHRVTIIKVSKPPCCCTTTGSWSFRLSKPTTCDRRPQAGHKALHTCTGPSAGNLGHRRGEVRDKRSWTGHSDTAETPTWWTIALPVGKLTIFDDCFLQAPKKSAPQGHLFKNPGYKPGHTHSPVEVKSGAQKMTWIFISKVGTGRC